MTKCNLVSVRKVLAGLCFFVGISISVDVFAAPASSKILVVYFGQQKLEDFDSKMKPFFLEKVRPCKVCEIENHTPYTEKGDFDLKELRSRLEALPPETSFVFFDFNMKVTDQNKDLVELLNKKVQSGLVVVGTAGIPKTDEASGSLSRTLLGQVNGALIIGELGDRDRLLPTAFYGPEMLTALRPPKDLLGRGYSPLIFAATLAESWPKRKSSDWVEHFQNKKKKSRKIWMSLDDLF